MKGVLVVAGLATVACGGSGGGLDDDTYVQVMARLSWARARYADTAEGDSVRAAALDEHGVTGQQLEDFVARLGDDPGRMQRLWEAIRLEVEVLDGVPRPESQLDVPDAERQESR
ncbi:MAG: hypothetical protein OXI39_13325 [Gemmatimonadota bacterium]|uniref:hypothetical protein n=1 Tax=Candidatus Palauibacter scopulicola TaxID=3056741 RepID=UPI002395B671|nr:hypothetical protein [Candidatus Palauibacter scopulicola]MDE2663972.1 hypothetical protein [Candidatus Palauibacter scopulicola]